MKNEFIEIISKEEMKELDNFFNSKVTTSIDTDDYGDYDKFLKTTEDERARESSILFENILFYPLKILWNGGVITLIIWAFIAWWGLIFGSIIAIILIFIFQAFELLMLPLTIIVMYFPFVTDEENTQKVHVFGLLWSLFVGYIIIKTTSRAW